VEESKYQVLLDSYPIPMDTKSGLCFTLTSKGNHNREALWERAVIADHYRIRGFYEAYWILAWKRSDSALLLSVLKRQVRQLSELQPLRCACAYPVDDSSSYLEPPLPRVCLRHLWKAVRNLSVLRLFARCRKSNSSGLQQQDTKGERKHIVWKKPPWRGLAY